MHTPLINLLWLVLAGVACTPAHPHDARAPGRREQVFYDYLNDVRRQVAQLEPVHTQLTHWTQHTRAYLESPVAQERYRVAGLYFEHQKNRSQGAHRLEDRFFTGGCQIHLLFYTPDETDRFEVVKGLDKSDGLEIDGYLFYYQIFTANPTSSGLETELRNIVLQTLEKYRGKFPPTGDF